MTVRIENNIAWLEGACGAADAEPLFAAMRVGRVTTVDISSCRDMHGAVAQVLVRFRAMIIGEAQDPFLRELVTPALKRRAQTDETGG